MKIQSAVDEYLVEIEVRKYTPKTIRSYRCNLNLFLRFCAEKLHVETVEALTPAVVRQFSRCIAFVTLVVVDIDTYCTISYNGTKYNITRVDVFEGYKGDLVLYAKKES